MYGFEHAVHLATDNRDPCAAVTQKRSRLLIRLPQQEEACSSDPSLPDQIEISIFKPLDQGLVRVLRRQRKIQAISPERTIVMSEASGQIRAICDDVDGVRDSRHTRRHIKTDGDLPRIYERGGLDRSKSKPRVARVPIVH